MSALALLSGVLAMLVFMQAVFVVAKVATAAFAEPESQDKWERRNVGGER